MLLVTQELMDHKDKKGLTFCYLIFVLCSLDSLCLAFFDLGINSKVRLPPCLMQSSPACSKLVWHSNFVLQSQNLLLNDIVVTLWLLSVILTRVGSDMDRTGDEKKTGIRISRDQRGCNNTVTSRNGQSLHAEHVRRQAGYLFVYFLFFSSEDQQ